MYRIVSLKTHTGVVLFNTYDKEFADFMVAAANATQGQGKLAKVVERIREAAQGTDGKAINDFNEGYTLCATKLLALLDAE